MKKFIVLILACNYLLVSSGIAMNTHYCMGSFASVNMYQISSDICGNCGMKATAGCCSDEYKFVKLQDGHQQAEIGYSFGYTCCLSSINNFFSERKQLIFSKDLLADAYDPPEKNLPLFPILYCVFRC